jgi:hypothetical protein
MQSGRGPSHIVPDRMKLRAVIRPPGWALLALGLAAGGGLGCTLLLDADANPYKCSTSADCNRFPNAVCDDARKQCVPRLPFLDGGTLDTGSGGTSGLTCEVSFDNALRIHGPGPDGGLRPLPEGP